MEFNIEVRDVTAVLLADGWHSVSDKSFRPGMSLFTEQGNPFSPVGYDVRGFQWRDPVGVCFCPAAAVLGLRYNAESSKKAEEIADAVKEENHANAE
jgi:hypothetical protein